MSGTLNLTPRRREYLRRAPAIYRFDDSPDWYDVANGRVWKVTVDIAKMRAAGWVTDGRRARRDMRWAVCLRRTVQGNALLAQHDTVEWSAGGVR